MQVSYPNETVQPQSSGQRWHGPTLAPQNYFPLVGYKYLGLIVLDTVYANRGGSPGAH